MGGFRVVEGADPYGVESIPCAEGSVGREDEGAVSLPQRGKAKVPTNLCKQRWIPRICGEFGGRQVASPTISTIVGNMKRAASKTIGYGIWQRSFHDHVIRDAKDYNEIADYIEANPLNWEADCFYGDGEENF